MAPNFKLYYFTTVLLVQLWISTAYILETKSAEPVSLWSIHLFTPLSASPLYLHTEKKWMQLLQIWPQNIAFVVFAGNQFLIRKPVLSVSVCGCRTDFFSVVYKHQLPYWIFPRPEKGAHYQDNASGSVLWKNTSGKEKCQVKLLQDVFFRPIYKVVK